MDSISTGIVTIRIEDPGIAAPSGRAASKGGSYDPNATFRPPQAPPILVPAPAPPVPRPAAPSAPPASDGTSIEEKIKAILRDPGAKQSLGKGTTAEDVAKMGPAFIDLLYNEIGRAKADYKPVVAAAPPPPRVDAPTPRKTESADVQSVRIVAPSPIPVVITGGQVGGAKPAGASVAAPPRAERPSAAAMALAPPPTMPVMEPEEPAPDFDWIKQLVQNAPTLANASTAAARGEADRTPYPMASESPTFKVVPPEPQPLPAPLPIKPETYEFAPAPTPESKPQPAYGLAPEPTPKPEPDTFGFEKPKADTFGLKKPTAYPVPKPEDEKIPLADSAYGVQDPPKPDIPRPKARVVTDAEKSRDQWKPESLLDDFKNYLPAGLGKKLDAMRGAYSAASKEAGANGAGMVGRAAAGAGEALVAAGPVAAFAAVTLAAHVAAKASQKATDAIEGMGRQAARFAANDHLGMFNAAVDGAKDTLREIPIVGDLYASRLGLAVAPINAMTTAVNAFVARGKELQGYSGPLAGANARAEFRDMLGDIKEAERLGPALARLTDAQSDADNAIREILLPIKEFVATKLAAALETGMAGWEAVKPLLETLGTTVTELLNAVMEFAARGLPGGEAARQFVEEEIRKRKLDRQLRDLQENGDPMREFLGALDALQLGGMGGLGSGEDQRRVAGPIFSGFGDILGK